MGTRRGALTKDVGATGINLDGWGEVGSEFLNEWRGTQNKVKRVKEMLLNSPTVAAMRMAIEMPIRDIDWQFVSDEGEEDPRVQLLDDALENMSYSWNDHIIDALLFPFYGWSLFSITYEQVGGRMLWKKLKPLGHDTIQRWLFDEDGGLAGVQQYPTLWPEPIPVDRLLLYRFRKQGNNPEGESILRPAWPAWYYQKNISQIEAIGIERNLAGLPVIKLPENANVDENDTASDWSRGAKLVRNARNDEQAGFVLPFGWDLQLLSSSGSGKAAEVDAVISRYEKRILMTGLAQFLMLGMDNVGALATSSSSMDFFTKSVNAVADIIAETFTKYAAERLLELNGYDARGVRLTHSPAGETAPEQLAAILQQVGGMLTWTPQDEVWLRSLLRMPEVDEGELEAAAAEKEARAAAMVEAMKQRQGQPSQDGEQQPADSPADGEDELSAWFSQPEVFAAVDNRAARAKFERQWQKVMADYFKAQQKALIKEIRAGNI